jgi:hypothetical protein
MSGSSTVKERVQHILGQRSRFVLTVMVQHVIAWSRTSRTSQLYMVLLDHLAQQLLWWRIWSQLPQRKDMLDSRIIQLQDSYNFTGTYLRHNSLSVFTSKHSTINFSGLSTASCSWWDHAPSVFTCEFYLVDRGWTLKSNFTCFTALQPMANHFDTLWYRLHFALIYAVFGQSRLLTSII